MSIVMPLRVAEITTTTGTGSLLLAGAPNAAFRSFAAHFGEGTTATFYVIEWDGGFEIGLGSFNGTNTLTRGTIIRSSNSDAIVSLPAGSKTVFALLDFGEPEFGFTEALSAAQVIALPGSAARFTGTSPVTVPLPALASLPRGFSVAFVNDGTANLTLDPSSTETIGGQATLVLAPGKRCTAVRRAAGWEAIGPFATLSETLAAALLRNGSQPPTANTPWGGFKITGLGNGTAATDAATFGQVSATSAAALLRNGSQPPTANTPWGGFKITGLANGTAANDAATFGQVPKMPTTSSGLGQVVMIKTAMNANVVLPSGGTWMWFVNSIVYDTNTFSPLDQVRVGVNAGGTTVISGGSNLFYAGFAWRIA